MNTTQPLPLVPPSRAVLLFALVLAACGGPTVVPPASPADLRSISEARAIELIGQTLGEASTRPSTGWTIDIGAERPLEVDLRLDNTRFGIEWVTPLDRDAYGDTIPQPDPSGQLRILPGVDNDANAQILVLDERMYRFDPDLERVEHGATGARDVEGRIGRDVRDFIEYVRGQGAQ